MPSAFERRVEPERENLVRQSEGDDTAAHGEDVGVVVLARQASGVEIVAERGADAGDLVRGDLLALAAAAEDDAAIGAPLRDRAADGDADRRVVDGRLAVGPVVVDAVPEPREGLLQVFLEREARMIGADSDTDTAALTVLLACLMRTNGGIPTRNEYRRRCGVPMVNGADVA